MSYNDGLGATDDEIIDDLREELSRFSIALVEEESRANKAEKRIAELESAAECWDALCACYRITCMGSAGLIEPMATGYAHVTLNFWTHKGPPPEGVHDEQDAHGRIRFGDFVKIAIANLKAQP